MSKGQAGGVRAQRSFAIALFGAGIATAAVGPTVMPTIWAWLLFVMLAWAAGTVWFRGVDWSSVWRKPMRPLASGEAFVDAVKLTFVPNVPLAESICLRLRANHIEAFYKRVPAFDALSTVTNDMDAAEVWVAASDLDRARAILGAES
jgi:hypothetical protein